MIKENDSVERARTENGNLWRELWTFTQRDEESGSTSSSNHNEGICRSFLISQIVTFVRCRQYAMYRKRW